MTVSNASTATKDCVVGEEKTQHGQNTNDANQTASLCWKTILTTS